MVDSKKDEKKQDIKEDIKDKKKESKSKTKEKKFFSKKETSDEIKQRLELEVKEAKENLLRVVADTENYKKRVEREKEDFKKFANESIIKKLLPVIDNFERAIESKEASKESIIEGVNLVLKDILKLVKEFGVEEIEAVGKEFDPNFHQAVTYEISEDKEDMVLKEMQKGYILNNRLIRPSMVVISKKE